MGGELTCPSSSPVSTESRLRARYTYDTVNRPLQQHGNNTVDVRLRLVLKSFHFVSTSYVSAVHLHPIIWDTYAFLHETH
jgi:hypothetical protein